MSTEVYKKGSLIYKSGSKMRNVGLIVKGSVQQKGVMDKLILEQGHLIGLAGCDKCVYPCDYYAKEDTTIFSFQYRNPDDFKVIFEGNDGYGSVFILAALKQASLILEHYLNIKKNAKDLYQIALSVHRDYKYLCSKYSVPEYELSRMNYLSAVDMEHAIPEWKEQYYRKLVTFDLEELKELFTCRELCIGTIHQAGSFMAEMMHRCEELLNYIDKSKSVILAEKKNDLFQLLFDLESRVSYLSQEKEELHERMEKIISFISKSGLYSPDLVKERIDEYRNYDFATCQEDVKAGQDAVWETENAEDTQEEELTCLEQILRYAGFERDEIIEFDKKLKEYMSLPDQTATDGEARSLRKWLTEQYYRCYKLCTQNALTQGAFGPIVAMFLNFGFMDVTFVGEDNANSLLELTDRLFACNMDGVHTFFEWLKSIYNGENEPSISELDMDFARYVKEAVRNGDIPADKEEAVKADPWSKVEYELDNMFRSGGKVTSGHITTFCPIISESDLLTLPENMLVTSNKVREAIDMVRTVDFGLFYREVMFSDEEHGISREYINQEIMPEIILMPNAGSKGMMWQVTAGARNNTAARFMLPILTTADIADIMIENCGRYRWEMCRKIQGSRWNDVTTPSLTSEYSDYLQYYRKNFELSQEAKDKLHNSIKRARNNFREVFVKDYENWIKFEAKGSFRLNKVARNILFTYCPFGIQIRQQLSDNPMYQESLNRFNIVNQRSVRRLTTLYRKYEENGGVITPELSANMEYYQL